MGMGRRFRRRTPWCDESLWRGERGGGPGWTLSSWGWARDRGRGTVGSRGRSFDLIVRLRFALSSQAPDTSSLRKPSPKRLALPGRRRILDAVENGAQTQDNGAAKERKLPPQGQRVMVRCRGFRCLAYLDKDGKWRNSSNNEELTEVLEVLYQW